MKKYNFYAGPAILSETVIRKASEAALEYEGTGLSLLEISHRSKELVAMMEETESLVKELLGLDDDWAVLFLTGGASSQFFESAQNLLNEGEFANYVDTGTWSTKAIKEAKRFGEINVIASSKDQNYSYIPKGYDNPQGARYLHITSNNTIFGTQFHSFPDSDSPIVCDMSSDIFCRPIDPGKFGMIYAGAQKNLGPAGVTLVLIRKSFLGDKRSDMPTITNYHTHIEKSSAFNTPPVFQIYVCLESLKWLKSMGGVEGMQKHNEAKAKILYDEIDRNSLFEGTAAKEDRSLMNVTFVSKDESHQTEFLAACEAAGCVGLKGHRSVGGFRASIYNAMPKEGIEVLVQIMKEFENKKG
ncbi:MAG: 3-phosphoserine/phosphohydroxythreonine transaminase [Bacteroidia bacterium]|nr:3-phosphoserine/phosphohydroxythreonine transaminase [Bacteroidia bacterium]